MLNNIKYKTRLYSVTFIISITLILHNSLNAQSQLQKIAQGMKQAEGPVWIDSIGLLFSDIKGNTIYNWNPATSTTKPYIKPSDSSNGLTLDREGRLIICQMLKRRVVRRELNGTITELVSTYNGKKFNSPNDVVVKSDGSIFFTDPDFNIPVGQKAELSIKGIYRISPTGGLQLLDGTFDKPNGICFSPDEKKLYVNESAKCKIYVWDVINDSTISNKKLFYSLPVTGYADGMKTDSYGNIFCTGPTGVWIISPDGVSLGKIATPETPSNCTWGDLDRKTLFITGSTSVYKIQPGITSVEDSKKKDQIINEFKLNNNYPNPFNPSTVISYKLPVSNFVNLTVFDVLGNEVATLVNEEQNAGSYNYTFSIGNYKLSSGIYFYKLQTDSFVETKKMLLLK